MPRHSPPLSEKNPEGMIPISSLDIKKTTQNQNISRMARFLIY